MSSAYENTLAKTVTDNTDRQTKAYRCGYSGNNAFPSPDILITRPTQCYAVEVKGPIQSDRCYVDADELQQLVDCTNDYTTAHLAVKFSRRELVAARYFPRISGSASHADDWDDMSIVERFDAMFGDAFDTRVTDSETLSIGIPDTDAWPSATAGHDDWEALLSRLGIPY